MPRPASDARTSAARAAVLTVLSASYPALAQQVPAGPAATASSPPSEPPSAGSAAPAASTAPASSAPSAPEAPPAGPSPPPRAEAMPGETGGGTTTAAPAPPAPASIAAEVTHPTQAIVHVAVDFPDAWLETRSLVDRGEWQRTCPAPCDRSIQVEGMEVRVTASGMRTSNAFRIDPGAGVARLRVAGGSATARDVGLTLLIAGVPVTFGGMVLFGWGTIEDKDDVRTGGIVALVAGAASVLVALPLLLQGSTHVRDDKGKTIAGIAAPAF